MNLNSEFLPQRKRGYFIILAIITFSVRILGDIIIYIFTGHEVYSGITIMIWKVLTTSLIAGGIVVNIFSKPYRESNIYDDVNSEEFFDELSRVIYLSLGLIVIQVILPANIIMDTVPVNIFLLLLSNIFAVFGLYATIYIAYFLYKWLNIRRHKFTKVYIGIIAIGLLSIFVFDIIFKALLGIKSVDAIAEVILICLILLILLAARKNHWIAVLPKNAKIRLLWFSMLGLTVCTFIFISLLNQSYSLSQSFFNFLPGLHDLSGFVFLYLDAYLLRIFFSTIAALPTTRIVERKTSELLSLSYLNKLISRSVDLDSLFSTVTQLAQNACEGTSAWLEIYDESKTTVVSMINISENNIDDIREIIYERYSLGSLENPLLIESFNDDKYFKNKLKNVPWLRSMMAIPISSSEEQAGTLVVLSNHDYGFEYDDLKVLRAFSDNVSIALENARLIQDSIEKEHYKRELYLAKEMQQKLLPQSLPELDNYSISAFSYTAEEVGGDYYDYIYLKDGSPAIIIGDVSGKGMNAAFYMAQLKGVTLSVANESTSASDLLKRINATLYGRMEKTMFITLTAVVLDYDSIQLSRAGHMPAILRHGDNIDYITPLGVGIGLVNKSIFNSMIEEKEVKLTKGDSLFLFTDGLNEMTDENDHEFGMGPIKEIMKNSSFTNADEINYTIKSAIDEFSGNRKLRDDMTVVSIMFKGNGRI